MDTMKFLELKIPPPVVFLISGGLMQLLTAVAPSAGFVLPARKPLSFGMAAVGGLFALPAILSFFRAGTTVLPEKPAKTTKLVVTGVYSVTRNPMYLALFFVLIAWAIYLTNFAAVIPLPLFVAYLTRFQIIPEERILASKFGSDYDAYARRVRRWL